MQPSSGNMLPRRALCMMMAIAVVAAAGCSQRRARLQTWKPATTPLQNVQSVAVLPFSGPHETGLQAQQSIHASFTQVPLFEVRPATQVAELTTADLYRANGRVNREMALRLGQQLGVDAVVAGHVRLLDRNGRSLGSAAVGFGVNKTTAVVALQVVEVQTGFVSAEGKGTELLVGDLAEHPAGNKAMQKSLDRLVQRAADKAAGELVPRLETTEVELANAWTSGGARQVRQGNELARNGRWQDAHTAWTAALAKNPQSHAALYNLGLAEEAAGNYVAAKVNFERAHGLKSRDQYLFAVSRCDTAIQDGQQVALQLQQQALGGRSKQIVQSTPSPTVHTDLSIANRLERLPAIR